MMRKKHIVLLAFTILVSTFSCARDTSAHAPSGSDGKAIPPEAVPADSVSEYSIANTGVSFSLPAEVVDERDVPRFSLDRERQNEREAALDERVVFYARVMTADEVVRDAPQTRPYIVNEILGSNNQLTTDEVWRRLEDEPRGLQIDLDARFPESFQPIEACSNTVGSARFSVQVGGTDSRGVHRDLLASGPGYGAVVYVNDSLVRFSLRYVSLSREGHPVLGEIDDFYSIKDGELSWRSETAPQAFYDSLESGEIDEPELVLLQDSWNMLMSTLQFDCQ
jgi:hypothetical protein